MTIHVERRQNCTRIIGVERRGAPIHTLEGGPLPDPTRLIDEDFAEPGLEASSSPGVKNTSEDKDH